MAHLAKLAANKISICLMLFKVAFLKKQSRVHYTFVNSLNKVIDQG